MRTVMVCFLAACVLAGTGAIVKPATGENYAGISTSQKTRVIRMIHLWFDKTGDANTMVCIANRESGFNPRAYNDNDWPSQSVAGIFQVAYPLWTANNPRAPRTVQRFWHHRPVSWAGFRDRLSDPVQSIRLAFIVYRHGGLGPWLAPGGC